MRSRDSRVPDLTWATEEWFCNIEPQFLFRMIMEARTARVSLFAKTEGYWDVTYSQLCDFAPLQSFLQTFPKHLVIIDIKEPVKGRQIFYKSQYCARVTPLQLPEIAKEDYSVFFLCASSLSGNTGWIH